MDSYLQNNFIDETTNKTLPLTTTCDQNNTCSQSNPDIVTTKAIVDNLEYLKNNQTHQEIKNELSHQGKAVLDSLDNVVTQTQNLLSSKNEGDQVQNMIFHSQKAAELTKSEKLLGQTQTVTSQVSQSVISFVKKLSTSSEFRNSSKDFIEIFMEIFNFYIQPLKDASLEAVDNVKLRVSDTVHGHQTTRDLLHNIVDIAADTTNKIVPENIQNDVHKTVNPHLQNAVDQNAESQEIVYHLGKDTVDIVKEYNIPEELITRLKTSLKRFQDNIEFQSLLDNLFDGIDENIEYTKNKINNHTDTVVNTLKESKADTEWNIAMDHAKMFTENLFNGKSLDPLIEAVKVFFDDIINDQELLDWFEKWQTFIRSSLRNIDTDFDTKELSYSFIQEKYQQDAKELYDEATLFFSELVNDTTNVAFAESFKTLGSDIFLDDQGNFTMKQELLDDFSKIIPILVEKIAFIPVPRFEYEDRDIFIVLNDLVLECSGLLPTNLNISTSGGLDLSVPEIVGKVNINMSRVNVTAKNVSFDFKKKSGLFRWTDSGKVDFSVPNKGITLNLTFTPWVSKNKGVLEKGFDLENCDVKLDSLKLKLHDTKNHDLIYKIFKTVIADILKKQLSKLITDNLTPLLDPTKPTPALPAESRIVIGNTVINN